MFSKLRKLTKLLKKLEFDQKYTIGRILRAHCSITVLRSCELALLAGTALMGMHPQTLTTLSILLVPVPALVPGRMLIPLSYATYTVKSSLLIGILCTSRAWQPSSVTWSCLQIALHVLESYTLKKCYFYL